MFILKKTFKKYQKLIFKFTLFFILKEFKSFKSIYLFICKQYNNVKFQTGVWKKGMGCLLKVML